MLFVISLSLGEVLPSGVFAQRPNNESSSYLCLSLLNR